jgi:hypothetical protein
MSKDHNELTQKDEWFYWWKKKKVNIHDVQVDMHDKEYYERLVYEKAKKYAAKDDDMHHDRDDRGDNAKYREGWWLW